jgi:FtsH-binding integral membrane protein
MIAGVLWLWVNRDPAKCLLAMMLTIGGWLAAVNTANDVINAIQFSSLFGTIEGAKFYREMVGWLTGGLLGGAVGAGLTAFGAGIAATAIRRAEAWMLIVVVGAMTGVLLYSAAVLDAIIVLFVPWQIGVALAIAYGLTAR